VVPLREIEKRVIRRPRRVEDAVPRRETQRGLGVPIPFREELEFHEDRSRHRDVRSAKKAPEFRLQVHAELERHEQGVRIQEDELGHRFRAAKASYLAVR